MTKKLLFTFLFFFGCFPLISQTITGKIVDKVSLEPIQNVAIITNLNRGSTSDIHGEFTLQSKNLESITFSSLGYVTLTLSFDQIKKLNYTILLVEKVNKLDEIQLNLAKISLDSILIKTQKSMKENYVSGALNSRFYSKENSVINFKKLELDLDKSSLLNGKNRKKAKNELTEYAANLKNSNPNFSNEFYGNIRTKKVYSEKTKKYLNIDKVDSVQGYKSMQNKKKITIEEAQKDLQNIVLKHLHKNETYKVSSGLFPIEDSLSIKEVINEVDSVQIKNTFNEYPAMSGFNTASVRAKFFNFKKQKNFLNEKYYHHNLENNTFIGTQLLYVLRFEPKKSKSKYSGKIFINPRDFTIAKIEYEFADGKRGQNLNLKWLLGIKVSEDTNKVTLLYEKNKANKVYVSYYKETRGTYAYVHRPIKFKENSATKNKVKFDIKIELDTKEITEVLVLDSYKIEAEETKPVTKDNPKKRFGYMSFDTYMKTNWKNRQLITDYLQKWK
ncbi:carboxypeptidase-like regulatory domain-containing protein [Polaribacter litorisediminis]|uniref:carboxypeptidase-like regulatory domain-containing protein n=1 Tax=Polaribacter litorisediminis TaxID=1908341 RepID=UPI001CBAB883|nr:carboxypeptidase-like regulatory domain-containing protein [Polaribacter litorisediminis]UAM99491.1 carboxypeptidase-like regulatory domain-containing protein [Polaribacter litorisediminis]